MLKRSDGFSLLMVMGSITLLSFVIFEFIFDTKLSEFRAFGHADTVQARLNARAGLNLGLARLQLYQESLNLLESNESLKKSIPLSQLKGIYQFPPTGLIFPVPTLPNEDVFKKTARQDLNKTLLIRGEMEVRIEDFSHLINLNLLRLASIKIAKSKPKSSPPSQVANQDNQQTQTMSEEEENSEDSGSDTEGSDDKNPATPEGILKETMKRLTELLDQQIAILREDRDHPFNEKYPDVDSKDLINRLVVYLNPPELINKMPELQDAVAEFNRIDLTPKHAAMADLSELYLIPGFDDDIVNLIKDQISPFGTTNIDLSKLTKKMLLWLFPDLTNEQQVEFFRRRDRPNQSEGESALLIETSDDLKKYFKEEGIMDETNFDERMKLFASAGIQFNNQKTHFKVISKGKLNQSVFTYEAIVFIPVSDQTPTPPPTNPTTEGKTSAKKIKFDAPRIKSLLAKESS